MPKSRTPKPLYTVKPISRKTNSRFERIRSLKCFQDVHQRLVEGWSLTEVARYIQDFRGEGQDVTREGLITSLTEYRKNIPPAELTKSFRSETFQKAADLVEDGMDELSELQKLYDLQMKRIGIDLKLEETNNKLLPTMTQEMRVAREILHDYAQLKMDLGLSKRHIGQVDVDARLIADAAQRYGSEAVGKVLGNPESRRRVLSLATKLLSASVEDVVLPPDGFIDAEVEIKDIIDAELGSDLDCQEDDAPQAEAP